MKTKAIKKKKPAATKKAKVPAKPATRENVVISMLLDESYSMLRLQDATISGFNEYVDSTRAELVDANVHFSAIKFDSNGIVKLQVGASIQDAIRLNRLNYTPRGGTPLFDAIVRTIQATDEVAGKNKATKIIVVIQTDGEENASTEFRDVNIVKNMVEERQGSGWEFIFIGAGINAFAAGSSIGIAAMNTMSYSGDEAGTRAVFGATARNSSSYAKGLCASMAYSSEQSSLAGESAAILRAKLGAKK